jgi:hypothetical protein
MPDEVLDAISLEQREERWRQILPARRNRDSP